MQHTKLGPNSDSNPFAQAAGAYGGNAQKTSQDPREVEARVLLKAAKMMEDLQNEWDEENTPESLEDTLLYNRQIWMIFYNTATENQHKDEMKDLRANIINLANFIFKREIEILSTPRKTDLDALISINRQISAGLMNGPIG